LFSLTGRKVVRRVTGEHRHSCCSIVGLGSLSKSPMRHSDAPSHTHSPDHVCRPPRVHHVHHMALTAPTNPAARPRKRRRLITPTNNLWPTSQAVLTVHDLRTLFPTCPQLVDRVPPAALQIPKGLMPIEWILRSLPICDEADLLPQEYAELLFPPSPAIPAPVTATPQLLPLATLATSIPVAEGRVVWTLRVRRAETPAATAGRIEGLLPKGAWLYRGTDLAQRGFVAPVLPAEATAELGAGCYTTLDLRLAVHLAGVGGRIGVLFVFREPEMQGLTVCEVMGREWEAVVAREIGVRKSGRPPRADVLVGKVSEDCWAARRDRRVPREDGTLVQAVWKSGEACRRLAEAVAAVVYLED
jgi:hypothetical protein